jgi:hypothetical protein
MNNSRASNDQSYTKTKEQYYLEMYKLNVDKTSDLSPENKFSTYVSGNSQLKGLGLGLRSKLPRSYTDINVPANPNIKTVNFRNLLSNPNSFSRSKDTTDMIIDNKNQVKITHSPKAVPFEKHGKIYNYQRGKALNFNTGADSRFVGREVIDK